MSVHRPVTVITGTSRGIGHFLANYYVQKGHRVAGCSRTESSISHESYRHTRMDITSEAQVIEWIDRVGSEFGAVTHLINCAATASMNHSLLTTATMVETIMKTNVFGLFLCCRESARQMKKQQFGRIVNFTTVALPLELEGEAVYSASKAAVESLTRTLSRELASFNITVNNVGPSFIETAMSSGVTQAQIKRINDRLPIKRASTYADISNIVDFFIRPESHLVTGQTLYLSGG